MRNQRIGIDPKDPTIKVTFLGKGWGVRLYQPDGTLWWDERFVEDRENIGKVCRDILRWYEKCGTGSPYSYASRHRSGIKDNKRRGQLQE